LGEGSTKSPSWERVAWRPRLSTVIFAVFAVEDLLNSVSLPLWRVGNARV
jgi:hypothetical protein